MTDEILLSIKNLSIGYDKNPLQRGFSFQLKRGEILSLIGPNGSGKSTLLKTLIKEIPPVDGCIFLNAENLNDFSLKNLAKELSVLLTIPVKPELMTAREVVATGRYPYTSHFNRLTEEDNKIIDQSLALLKAESLSQKLFLKLSDGQKQRILFARAICQQGQLFILDEPTSYLDVKWRLQLVKILKSLASQGKTVITSLHEIDLALKLSDRILCLGKDFIQILSDEEESCKSQIQRLYDLDSDFFTAESHYSQLVKDFCNRCSSGKNSDKKTGENFLTNKKGLPDNVENLSRVQKTGENPPLKEKNLQTDVRNPSKIKSIDENLSEKSKNLQSVVKINSSNKEKSLQNYTYSQSLMIQGTMSSAGKSFIVAALCRIFLQDGYSVAPFKSQNMALNSFVTKEGLEMGRAQVMQAQAAKIEPSVLMNPVLLKPTSDTGSQVIVNGKSIGNMRAKEYFSFKKSLLPQIKEAYEKLSSQNDIILIEGAGSPAEINLKENDIVNMGMAELADSPVLLVADIDRGGVFAQLLGTVELLNPEERSRVKGFIINKFRGDKSILDSGIKMIEEKTGIPVVGTIPYINITLDDEDSLSQNLNIPNYFQSNRDALQIAVIRLPHISNFTDLNPLLRHPAVNLYYVDEAKALGNPDALIIPGTKNTLGDLDFLKESGLFSSIQDLASRGAPVIAICGGFQLAGQKITDSQGLEGGRARSEGGLGLLPVESIFTPEKKLTQFQGKINVTSKDSDFFAPLNDLNVSGYEIHQGRTKIADNSSSSDINDSDVSKNDLQFCCKKRVFGTYLHGIFDEGDFTAKFLEILAKNKGLSPDWLKEKSQIFNARLSSQKEFAESQFNLLADTVRRHLDMDLIYNIIRK